MRASPSALANCRSWPASSRSGQAASKKKPAVMVTAMQLIKCDVFKSGILHVVYGPAED
ncbi:hypothetical protein [Catenulispora rubra]|uniref:hypothetical protein n=1 Tax=Catenulispora rubra TaxID=280293 RepID=UPI0018925062|nr:hypothetical protein [Catenulispora rubra]